MKKHPKGLILCYLFIKKWFSQCHWTYDYTELPGGPQVGLVRAIKV